MRITEWALRNPIAISLASFIVITLGVYSFFNMERTIFPAFSINAVTITVDIEGGATPRQVDSSVIQPIQAQLQSVGGIAKITSTAFANRAHLQIDVDESYDVDAVLKVVRNRVDAIDDLPDNAGKPRVMQVESRLPALYLGICGVDMDATSLDRVATEVAGELRRDLGLAYVESFLPRAREITILAPSQRLLAMGLSIESLADQIRGHNLELFAGNIRGEHGQILISSGGPKQTVHALRNIPIAFDNGETLLLEDVVGRDNIRDGFAGDDVIAEVNGKPSVVLVISKGDNDDLIKICDDVKRYAAKKSLPDSIELVAFFDNSVATHDNLNLIIKNGILGLALLLLSLALFLDWKIALWTTSGVAFALIGTIAVMKLLGHSMNMVMMLGFGVATGIIVDDAIIIGERYFRYTSSGVDPDRAAARSVSDLAVPIFIMVVSSVAAFFPLLLISGVYGELVAPFPIVIIVALLLSLVESLWILPTHLAHHSQPESRMMRLIELCASPLIRLADVLQPLLIGCLNAVGEKVIRPSIGFFLKNRYAFAVLFVSGIVFQHQLIAHQFIAIEFDPDIDAEYVQATLTLPVGTPLHVTEAATRHREDSAAAPARAAAAESGGVDPVQEQILFAGRHGPHTAGVTVHLIRPDAGRKITGKAFLDRWRASTTELPRIRSLEFTVENSPTEKPIDVQLLANDDAVLRQAESDLLTYLKQVDGVVGVNTDNQPGALAVRVQRKPHIANEQLSETAIISTLANRYVGTTVDSFYRDDKEVKISVRADPSDRASYIRLRTMPLQNGVTLNQVADLQLYHEPVQIRRINGQHTVAISADVDTTAGANITTIKSNLHDDFLPELKQRYPGLDYSYSEATQESVDSMFRSFAIALIVIYLILASYLRSYIEPIIVMVAILISLLGAVLGHWALGQSLTLMSGFGIIGLAGIVVNDSIILVEAIKGLVREGQPIEVALPQGALNRLLPIFLTSVTLILSSCPLLFEDSLAAEWLVPINISFVFGLAFSTIVILFVIPIGYAIILDVVSWINKIIYGKSPSREELIVNV